MYRIAYIVLVLTVNWMTTPLFAQNAQKVDSLELSLTYATTDIDKIKTLLALTAELQNTDPNKALEFVNIALSLSQEQHYINGEINAMIIVAEIYWGMSNFKLAMEYAVKAKMWAGKENMPRELALSHRLIGLVYVDLGNYNKAAEHFFESLKIFEDIKDKEGTSRALSSIGYVYFDQKNYDKALEYYFSSLNLAKEINDQLGIARGLNNIAAVYGSREEYEKVTPYLEEAIVINQELGKKQWVGINYMNLGLTYQELGNLQKAINYFDKALVIFAELENIMWQSKCYLNVGTYYTETHNYNLGLDYAKIALELGQKHQMKKIIYDAYELFRNTYLAKGDTVAAYNYILLKYEAKDSLNVEKNKALLSRLELQYEFEKKEQEERIQQQQKDFIIVITLISLVFALIIIFLLWARQRIKAKNTLLEKKGLEEKLEFKNKEFTLHVMSLMKKNEILTNVSNKLIQVEKEAVKDETKDAIKRIAAELQKSTESEVWEEFELRFSQVHSDFYEKLLKKFPNLTPSEQKLCAFLRLNMTTKDISELTGQSISTLETARYRLRKKLNISNSQVNLIAFLSQI